MATGTYTGTIKNFADQTILNARAWIHPEGPAVRADGGRFLSDKTIELDLDSNGSFTVELEAGHLYSLELRWTDQDRDRIGRSWWSPPFRVPSGATSGDLSDFAQMPRRNGMIRIRQSSPDSSEVAQYVYVEPTGDLHERTA